MWISPRWREAARRGGAAVFGPVGQGEFLDSARHRASAPSSWPRPIPARHELIAAHSSGLTTPEQMGTLFKALAIVPPVRADAAGILMRLMPMRIHRADNLADLPGIAHGFFGRNGGVSTGIYASRSIAAPARRDEPAAVAENRAPRRGGARRPAHSWSRCTQIHSADVHHGRRGLGIRGQAEGRRAW